MVYTQQKARHVDHENRTESQEINLYICAQLIFNRGKG